MSLSSQEEAAGGLRRIPGFSDGVLRANVIDATQSCLTASGAGLADVTEALTAGGFLVECGKVVLNFAGEAHNGLQSRGGVPWPKSREAHW